MRMFTYQTDETVREFGAGVGERWRKGGLDIELFGAIGLIIILSFDPASADKFKNSRSNSDQIAVLECRADDFDIVYINSVSALEIFNHRLIVFSIEFSMVPRYGLFFQ